MNVISAVTPLHHRFLHCLSLKETHAAIVSDAVQLFTAIDGILLYTHQESFTNVYGSSPSASSYTVRKNGFEYKILKNCKILYEKNDKNVLLGVPLFYDQQIKAILVLRFSKTARELDKNLLVQLQWFTNSASLALRKAHLEYNLHKAIETRDTMISITSHELRTPLTSIHGYVQLLNSKLQSSENSEGKWIRQLSKETKRLVGMMDDLLQINRIRHHKIHYVLQEHHLSEIVTNAIQKMAAQYPKRRIQFSNQVTDTQDTTICDAEKMTQVITALLHNGIKFSNSDKPLDVSLKTSSTYLKLTIKDYGTGITKEDMPFIFDEFYKGQHTGEGMGLGLFLARAVVDTHHGILTVLSKPSKGTKVEMKLKRI